MPKPSKPDADSGNISRKKVAFAVLAVAAIILSGMAVYGLFNNYGHQKNGSFASEPFPALWQQNFTGTPSSIVTSADGMTYFLVDSNTTWTDGNITWMVYAVELGTGKISWDHSLTISSPGVIQPDLYLRNGDLFFIGGGQGLYSNGVASPSRTATYSMFVVPFNGTGGQMGKVSSIPLTSDFGSSGTFAVNGGQLYLAWISLNGKYYANVNAYSAFSGNSSLSQLWNSSVASPTDYNTNIAMMKVDKQVLLLPVWNLIGFNTATGKQLFSSPYNTFGTDSNNVVNGALVNSTLYFVSELKTSMGIVDLNLVGIDFTAQILRANTTIGTSSIGVYPLSVAKFGSELVVETTSFYENYVVTTTSGKVLWNNTGISYATASSSSSITPGRPVGVLSNGNWILTSVEKPSGTLGVATQYFEEVDPSNGKLVWIHEFSFVQGAHSSMFVPPSLFQSPQVIVISTESSYLVYRWGSSVGCVAI